MHKAQSEDRKKWSKSNLKKKKQSHKVIILTVLCDRDLHWQSLQPPHPFPSLRTPCWVVPLLLLLRSPLLFPFRHIFHVIISLFHFYLSSDCGATPPLRCIVSSHIINRCSCWLVVTSEEHVRVEAEPNCSTLAQRQAKVPLSRYSIIFHPLQLSIKTLFLTFYHMTTKGSFSCFFGASVDASFCVVVATTLADLLHICLLLLLCHLPCI